MAGISDEAALSLENHYLFNGKLLNHKEFSDNGGLDWYSYGMREYDPQIGRFFRVDPLASKFPYLTPYQYASNDPITNIDLDGLEGKNFNYLTHLLRVFLGTGDHPESDEEVHIQAGERRATEGTLNYIQKLGETYNEVYGSVLPGYSALLNVGEGKYGSAALYLGMDMFGGELFKGGGSLLFRGVEDISKTFGIASDRLESLGISDITVKIGSRGGKFAVIGQGMERVEGFANELGDKIDVFKPTETALKDWQELLKNAGGKALSDDVVRGTELYKENVKWIDKMIKRGYDIIDVGSKKETNKPKYIL